MNKFKSVKITHNIWQRIDFSYLAEFFRFIGIFVCEEILTDPGTEKTKAEENTVYSAQVYVGKQKLQAEEAEKLDISMNEYENRVEELLCSGEVLLWDCPSDGIIISDLLQKEDEQGKKDQKRVLQDFLEKLLGNVFEPEDTTGFAAAQLQDLIDIYVDHRIWFHSLNMQYYGRKPSEVIEKAEDCFLAAQKAVQEVLDRRGDSDANEQYLYEYALLWCQVKANSACDYNKEVLYFSVEKLAERCRRLYKRYPGFTNALILQGLSYEPSSSSANEAVVTFREALDEMGSECFTSAVYYWIGKRYEAFLDKREVADRNYKLACQRKEKFRNIFKLAMADRDKGNIEAALEQFEKIPGKLTVKRNMHYEDPLELEYLFKVYFQQSNICYKGNDYARAIEYGIRCKAVWEDGIKDSMYFKDFYGVDAEGAYKKVLRERLNVSRIYRILMECYTRVFNQERADHYREKIQKAE